jgi:putative transposase
MISVTKDRYPVLAGGVGERAGALLREIVWAHEMSFYANTINRDHLHMLLPIPPLLSVSKAAQLLKSKRSSQGQKFAQAAF